MGQQQFLLLVLCIVAVGGAVVVGAHALADPQAVNNRDMVFQEALVIVADIQLWKLKPTVVGGGADVRGFKNITFRSMGYSHALLSNRVHKTENGCYRMRTRGDDHHLELIISAPSCGRKDYVAHVLISGPGPGDRHWQHGSPATFPMLEQ